jgi:23S rRNA pseudoU1915 N3-methylase RlmH
MELTPHSPSNGGYKVAVCASGEPLTDAHLKAILDNPRVSFYIGDSKGLPEDVVSEADEVVSVSELNIYHQLEAAILTASVENTLLNSVTCRV